MTKISNPSPNVFNQSQDVLERAANLLKRESRGLAEAAADNVVGAGEHASDVASHLSGAAANAVFATGAVLQGTVDAIESVGHAGAASAFAGVGTLGWVVEGLASTGRFIAKNLSRGFAGLANLFTGVLKDGKTTTVRELAGDPNAVRFSEKMFGKAAGELNKAGDAMNASWNSYINAVSHAAGSVGNVGMAAAHTAGVISDLIDAGMQIHAAGVLKLGEVGARAAAVAVEYAEKGMAGARDAAILAARIAAATANSLAVAGQGEVTVDVEGQIKAFEAELAQLQAA